MLKGDYKIHKLNSFFWLFSFWIYSLFYAVIIGVLDIRTIGVLFISLSYVVGFNLLLKVENRYKIDYSPAYYLFYSVCFIKYYVMPLSLCLSQVFNTFGPSVAERSFFYAVLLTVYEMICVIFIRVFYLNNYLSKHKRSFCVSNLKCGRNVVPVFLLVLITGIIISFIPGSRLIPEQLFVLGTDFDVQENAPNNGAWVTWWKYIFFIATVSLLYSLYKKYSINIFYYLTLLVILLFVGVITGTSRWAILFFLMISLYLCYQMYGARVKKILFPIIFVGFVTIISITMFKFSWVFDYSENLYMDFFNVMIGQLQSYFSGPNLVAQALEMKDNPVFANKITIVTFFNDFLGSVPTLAGHIDQTNRINYYFNRFLFDWYSDDTTQIIPMNAVGTIYLNALLSPIFVMIFTYLGFILEYIGISDRRLFYKFIYLYASFWCVLAICFCPQIIWGNLIGFVLPIYIIYKFLLAKYF